MEFRLMVNGQPATEWEAIRARDVDLWKQSTRETMQLGDRDVIEAQSRKVSETTDRVAVTDSVEVVKKKSTRKRKTAK